MCLSANCSSVSYLSILLVEVVLGVLILAKLLDEGPALILHFGSA